MYRYEQFWTVNWFDGANSEDLITAVFSSAHDDLDGKAGLDTARDALSYNGGKGLEDAERNLLRAGAAAWLNTGSFTYGFGDTQLVLTLDLTKKLFLNFVTF